MVAQPTGIRVVGGSNPSPPTLTPPPAAALKSADQDSNRRLRGCCRLRYHWTAGPATSTVRPHCL